jgi:uncharacterized protein (UPF0333 family)
MYVILFLVLVILVAILVVYLLFSRTPTLTPKKVIVETISAADQRDEFQRYRSEIAKLFAVQSWTYGMTINDRITLITHCLIFMLHLAYSWV